jgi:ubiquitin-protein ligase
MGQVYMNHYYIDKTSKNWFLLISRTKCRLFIISHTEKYYYFYNIFFYSSTAGTPYYGGAFRVKLALSKDFPSTPPKAYFLTKIFHPNVANNGEICVNTLKKDWKSDLGIKHILLVSTHIYL